jgi:hypothetical protein
MPPRRSARLMGSATGGKDSDATNLAMEDDLLLKKSASLSSGTESPADDPEAEGAGGSGRRARGAGASPGSVAAPAGAARGGGRRGGRSGGGGGGGGGGPGALKKEGGGGLRGARLPAIKVAGMDLRPELVAISMGEGVGWGG